MNKAVPDAPNMCQATKEPQTIDEIFTPGLAWFSLTMSSVNDKVSLLIGFNEEKVQ